MDSGLIYANARVKAIEGNLLSGDKVLRLLDSVALEDAVKVLIESGYGGGSQPESANAFEKLLQAEDRAVTAFIREILPGGLGMDIFFRRLDYHNAKALIKAKYLREGKPEYMLAPEGLEDSNKLGEKIMNDDYSGLNPHMAGALTEIDRAFAEGMRSPRFIDVTLDSAFFKEAGGIAAKGSDVIKRYFTAFADLSNISAFIRCRRAGLPVKSFIQGFAEGGSIDRKTFESIYDSADEALPEKLKPTPYYELALKAVLNKSGALVEFETATDDFLLNIFKKEKYDMFSAAPVAGYYLAKMNEIRTVRMILVCIKNGVDKLLVKQRLRDLYA